MKKAAHSKKRSKPSKPLSLIRILFLCIAALFLLLVLGWGIYMRLSPIRIGVLLKFTGPESLPFEQVLEWAKETSGKNIEFVFIDANTIDIKKAAEPLLRDHSIRVVIGPESSDQAMELAPLFIAKKKLLISPTATSADLFRAFAGQRYFWRTVESDVAQVNFILEIMKERQVKKIALIYANTTYGKTFFDWVGFYATEYGIDVTSIQALHPKPDYDTLVANALKNNPDYIICALSPVDTVEIKKRLDKKQTTTRLIVTDLSEKKYVLDTLGSAAEGLESTRPAADPTSGFDAAFQERFKEIPPPYMATTYDAFMLASAALARQEYVHSKTFIPLPFGERIADSLEQILYHQSNKQVYSWNELATMFDSIRRGALPHLKGASGELIFDVEKGVDPTNTYYSYSTVEQGRFVKQKTAASHGGNDSIVETKASDELMQETNTRNSAIALSEKKNLRAVILATSDGWNNYRHQSDALAVYQLLKSQGVDDEKITLFLADDVPRHQKNKPLNSLFHTTDGTNNYDNVQIDFSGEAVNLENFQNTLLDLLGDEHTNVLIYIVDHGGAFDEDQQLGGETGGDYLKNEGMIPFANGDILRSSDLAAMIQQLKDKKSFRQMFVVVEACYGAAMGRQIKTPGVLFISGASDQEVSYGANYSPAIDQWLADSFTYQFIEAFKNNPNDSLDNFYRQVYLNVAGSHVTIANHHNFGNLVTTSVRDFFSP